jgi:hypothetical protein
MRRPVFNARVVEYRKQSTMSAALHLLALLVEANAIQIAIGQL